MTHITMLTGFLHNLDQQIFERCLIWNYARPTRILLYPTPAPAVAKHIRDCRGASSWRVLYRVGAASRECALSAAQSRQSKQHLESLTSGFCGA